MGLLEQNRKYHEAQSSLELLPNYFSWTYGIFRHHITGNVVELGCGAGLGIRCYLDKAQKVFAVDHNDELLRRVKANNPTDKVETIAAREAGALPGGRLQPLPFWKKMARFGSFWPP